MQLDLALTTNEIYCYERNARNEIVIYKTDNEQYEKAYQQVMRDHPQAKFIKENNFKVDLCNAVHNKDFVMFMVDDCVFTGKYSIKDICDMLSIGEGALGFSLRLGSNTKYCYSLNIENSIPDLLLLNNNKRMCAFNWTTSGPGDFSYPLEVSSSIYRTQQIMPFLESMTYTNPNILEWLLSNTLSYFKYVPYLLCYQTSVAFCNPINRVQTVNNNRVGVKPQYTSENLLSLYDAGYRIDHNSFDDFISNGAHQEVDIDLLLAVNDNEYKQ